MANVRLKSLRQSVWRKDVDGRDIGEALRDLYTAFRGLTEQELVEVSGVSWATPFHIASDHIPKAVLMVRGRLFQQPGVVANGAVDWTWINDQVRVDGVSTLTVGVRYDLVFHLLG